MSRIFESKSEYKNRRRRERREAKRRVLKVLNVPDPRLALTEFIVEKIREIADCQPALYSEDLVAELLAEFDAQ